MTWVKFDDDLPNNRRWRRLVRKDPAAACLWVASICWASKNLTDGMIPKAELEEVAPVQRPEQRAQLLVEDGAWEDKGDAWYVHDFHDYQPPSAAVLAKREEERAKKAKARQRGSARSGRGDDGRYVPQGVPGGHTQGHMGGHPPGHPEGRPSGHPEGLPDVVPRDGPRESPRDSSATRPVPSRESSSSSDSRPPAPGRLDDDDGRLDPDTEAAIAAAGQARLERREAEKGQVSDHARWLAADRRRTLEALGRGDRSVLDVAPPTPNGGSKVDPLEASAAAQRQLAERNERRRRGEACPTCADNGTFERDDGAVVPCDCLAKTPAPSARASA